jgi:hypothetical protein
MFKLIPRKRKLINTKMNEECFICAEFADTWIQCKTCSKKVCTSCVQRIRQSPVLRKICPFCKSLYDPSLRNVDKQDPFAFVMNFAYSFVTLLYFVEMILNDE